MSALEFIAAVLKALAWPLAAVVIALLFRSKILELLSSGMKRLKIGPVEAEWDVRAAVTGVEVEQARSTALPTRPADSRRVEVQTAIDLARERLESGYTDTAVTEAFAAIEQSLLGLLIDAGVGVTQLHVGGAGLAKLAEQKGLITEKTATAIEGLAVLRNLAANTDVGTTMDRATEYLTMTEGVLYAIENPPS
ncbi:hypothetical protein [Kribbella sancticallisti]|uniref:hypothetical protein n=1 Tax=Kribbella sancticallisti TaxID=460087 RepID=UPI0031D7C188